MPRTTPYLQRRGNTLCFRIVVPVDVRQFLKCCELTKTLETCDPRIAVPRCLVLAARAKYLFNTLREMTNQKKTPEGFNFEWKFKYEWEDELGKQHSIEAEGEPHEQEAALQGIAAMRGSSSVNAASSMANESRRSAMRLNPAEPKLFDLTANFLEKYPKKHEAMLKKHQSCIPAFCEVVGNKPISELRHMHFQEFFDLIQRLPPRWSDIQRRNKLSIREIAAQNHETTISGKTFGYTYKTSINQFLSWAKEGYRDQGFPEITIDKIVYGGDRENGEGKQRPFTLPELKRLFEGSEMSSFAADPNLAHCYWLATVGLFTGARVNEICQINPQTDILQEPESGIWYFWFTAETEGNDLVKKRTKNTVSTRVVPIHSKLIDLGFLEYFERTKATGATLLFPMWVPSKRRASPEAEKWFCKFLRETGLRDETPGKKIVGMHAFRHTLSNAALNAGVDESSIVGHARKGESNVARGYRGALALTNQRQVIEKIGFDVKFIKPV